MSLLLYCVQDLPFSSSSLQMQKTFFLSAEKEMDAVCPFLSNHVQIALVLLTNSWGLLSFTPSTCQRWSLVVPSGWILNSLSFQASPLRSSQCYPKLVLHTNPHDPLHIIFAVSFNAIVHPLGGSSIVFLAPPCGFHITLWMSAKLSSTKGVCHRAVWGILSQITRTLNQERGWCIHLTLSKGQ